MSTSGKPAAIVAKPPPSKARRLEAIDAARGSAMLFVFLSHFGTEYFRDADAESTTEAIRLVTMVATPTFMIISGMMLGYLYHLKREGFSELRLKLVDRGLFFLFAGHALISLAYWPRMGSLLAGSQMVFITDVIGLTLAVGPFLITRMGAAARIAAGMIGYIACWAVILNWLPRTWGALLVKNILFGVRDGEKAVLWYSFSVLPWFCLYLLFTVAGERLAGLATGEGSRGTVERYVYRLASFSLATCLWFVMVRKVAKRFLPSFSAAMHPFWLTISQKTPPGPIYALFYGGIGLMGLSLLLRYGSDHWLQPYFNFAKVLGQVSFFAFMAQYFVFVFLLNVLRPAVSPFWPLWFVAVTVPICWGAMLWHRKGWNRFLSFRYLWQQLSADNRLPQRSDSSQ
jgi:uncharacterized membrane protein